MTDTSDVRVVIVGSGFSGLGMAYRLLQQGIRDLVVLERSMSVGGVWQANTYPGLTCDVPSHLYSLSFAPNPDWSSTYSPQPEIQAYLERCADQLGLRPFIRTGVEVDGAAWDDSAGRWRVTTTDAGTYAAQLLISAVGPITEPKVPDVPGLDSFEGTLMHSSRWDPDHDLTGEVVASVGTGSSAIQYVPEIAERVRRLFVFQRTPPWVIPSGRRRVSDLERAVYRRLPWTQQAVRGGVYVSRELLATGLTKQPRMLTALEAISRRHLARAIEDRDLRRAVTPQYSLGCKRILPSNRWYPALTRPNVELVPYGLREVHARSVVDAVGVEREVDTIVLGTGYHVTDPPFATTITGRGGRTLAETWRGSPRAHLGSTVPGFPNLFLMLGPNTGQGHGSMVYMAEAQMEHICRAVAVVDAAQASTIEVTREAFDAYNRAIEERMRRTVWSTGGCRSYYLDATGRNSAQWPDWTWRFRRLAKRLEPSDYRLQVRDDG